MIELTRREVVAMWLWGAEYAKSGLGAIEWCKRLTPYKSQNVDDFIAQYEEARTRDLGASQETPNG